ncbi:P-loop NTPase fold protein [Mucilaginibacter sabulilitoris]|uniref:P-loop NTPase fold protein n=1 Tax=Mucilaginibacter sabulilitoris TaxID=1173583 RepID=A0ABZ0TT96_9SPHI|nr:P-loop NTPase fold protein [Mucilaginibacter sabulilitoris]WPU96226.1 P-loop NTPase fold protein [Mucilaginibacter sabulilitoris]
MNKINLRPYFPALAWNFAILSAILFFRIPVSSLLDTLMVKPLFAKFDNSLLTNLLLIILSVLTGVWLWRSGSPRFLLLLSLFVLALYVIEASNPYWHFYSLRIIPFLHPLDIVAATFILPGFKVCFPVTPLAAAVVNNNGFAEDLPVVTLDGDLFQRRIVAKELATMINITPNQKSFAIGVLGSYGSGKTSFINLINLQLDQAKTEVIYFNPWSAETAANIQKDFFDLLAAKLADLNSRLPGLIIKYSRKLSRLDSSTEKFVKQLGFISNLIQQDSYLDDYDQINALLLSCGKKIVVTIDDVDRLYPNEVMEVLRLIRNTANFSNIFYLVAYERSYVEESIRTLNRHAPGSYLDKIIQMEIPLPKRENNDLIDIMSLELEKIVTAEDMISFKEQVVKHGFESQYDMSFSNVLRNSRDVVKFINNFKITYKLLGRETLFDNLFVLELLKFRYPLIYDRLFERTDEILYDTPVRSAHEEYYQLRTYKEDKNDLLHFARTLRAEQMDEQDVKLISSLLRNLFFRFNRSKAARNAIIYPSAFGRYFRYRISSTEISERRFREAFSNGLEALKNFINECVDAKLTHQISTRLFQENVTDRVGFELKIAGIFYIGPKFVEQKGVTGFNYQALIELLYNYDNRLSNKYYGKSSTAYIPFLNGLFANAPFPYLFHNNFIHWVVDGEQNIGINHGDLVNFQVSYFCEYVNLNGLTQDGMWLFWGVRKKFRVPEPGQRNAYRERWEFDPLIVPHILDFIARKDPLYFLKGSINADMGNKNTVAIHEQFILLFGKPEDLRLLVAGHTQIQNNVKEDYLAFFDACALSNFKNWVEYDFKTELKPERSDWDDY